MPSQQLRTNREALPGEFDGLRIAFLAGGLGQGGAERQFVYAARALREIGASFKVWALAGEDHWKRALEGMGVEVIDVGASGPFRRLGTLGLAVRRFRPSVVHAVHAFMNPYAALVARACGAASAGSIRSDFFRERASRGRFGRFLATLPGTLIANSRTAIGNASRLGFGPERIRLLPNVIDLDEFDEQARRPSGLTPSPPGMVVAWVGRLVPVKRVDVFVKALARARRDWPSMTGVVIGEGPCRADAENLAETLALGDGLVFAGSRDDVPALLCRSDALVLSSATEGFPNVVLEAMAARLPVVTTAAGDAAWLVREGATGFVVPHEDADAMAERLVRLARSPGLRKSLGAAGRADVEANHEYRTLAPNLRELYRRIPRTRAEAAPAEVAGPPFSRGPFLS